MGTTRISEKKVKSILLPKNTTNFSMRFAFVGYGYGYPTILSDIRIIDKLNAFHQASFNFGTIEETFKT
jgi:hypothetical protein